MSILENNRVPKRAVDVIEETEEKLPVEHKFEAVIESGGVTVKKQSGIGRFFRQLFADDMETVKETFKKDVLVPFLQDGISGIFHDGIDLLIYGNKGKSKRRGGLFGSRTNYADKYYRSSLDSGKVRRSSDYDSDEDVEVCDQTLLKFDSRAKAETVLDAMADALERFKAVSVADLYDLAGVSNTVGEFTDKNWGWTGLEGTKVRRARGGGYYLDLPRVEDIRDLR